MCTGGCGDTVPSDIRKCKHCLWLDWAYEEMLEDFLQRRDDPAYRGQEAHDEAKKCNLGREWWNKVIVPFVNDKYPPTNAFGGHSKLSVFCPDYAKTAFKMSQPIIDWLIQAYEDLAEDQWCTEHGC